MNIDDLLKLPTTTFSQQWLGKEEEEPPQSTSSSSFPYFTPDRNETWWDLAADWAPLISEAIQAKICGHPQHFMQIWVVATPVQHGLFTHKWVVHPREPLKSYRSSVLLFRRTPDCVGEWELHA